MRWTILLDVGGAEYAAPAAVAEAVAEAEAEAEEEAEEEAEYVAVERSMLSTIFGS